MKSMTSQFERHVDTACTSIGRPKRGQYSVDSKVSGLGYATTIAFLGSTCDQQLTSQYSKGIKPCFDPRLQRHCHHAFDIIGLNDAAHVLIASRVHMQVAFTKACQPEIEIP